MKRCELCTAAATMYCESDSASLCWDCDSKVHSANFLVERHSRVLLCHVCRSPTAWTASGPKLGRTISVCEGCVRGCSGMKEEREERVLHRIDSKDDVSESVGNDGIESDGDDNNDDESEEDEGFDSDDDDDDDDDDVEDEEEQVVPWTWPPSTSSSSSDIRSSSIDHGFRSKRLRNDAIDFCSDDEFGCSSTKRNITSFSARDSGGIWVDSIDHPKRPRTHSDPVNMVQCGLAGSGTSLDLDTIARLCKHDVTSANNAEVVIEMSQDTWAVGSGSGVSP